MEPSVPGTRGIRMGESSDPVWMSKSASEGLGRKLRVSSERSFQAVVKAVKKRRTKGRMTAIVAGVAASAMQSFGRGGGGLGGCWWCMEKKRGNVNIRIESGCFWRLGVLWKHGPLADRSTAKGLTWRTLPFAPITEKPRKHPPIPPIYTAMAHLTPTHVRSLYRSLLRELPPLCRKSSAPLHARLRESFSSPATTPSSQLEGEQADQLLTYLRAQRMYTTLLERYNPSLRMETEDRVRLSARRVGLNMPAERERN